MTIVFSSVQRFLSRAFEICSLSHLFLTSTANIPSQLLFLAVRKERERETESTHPRPKIFIQSSSLKTLYFLAFQFSRSFTNSQTHINKILIKEVQRWICFYFFPERVKNIIQGTMKSNTSKTYHTDFENFRYHTIMCAFFFFWGVAEKYSNT